MAKYSDAALGFVDASIVAVAERLKIKELLTTDRRHFSLIRPRHCPTLISSLNLESNEDRDLAKPGGAPDDSEVGVIDELPHFNSVHQSPSRTRSPLDYTS
jgi:hypothetical protein